MNPDAHHRSPSHRRGVSRPLAVILAVLTAAVTTMAFTGTATAQQRAIELETIEIESEVPRRVAQFFVQRDQLQYEQMEDQPTFMPELLETVEEEPF